MALPSEPSGDGRHLPLSSFDELGQIPVAAGPGDVRMVPLADLGFTAEYDAGEIVISGGGGGSSLPEIETGDAGKSVVVNESEDGYELAEVSGGGSSVSITQFTNITGGAAGETNLTINLSDNTDETHIGSPFTTSEEGYIHLPANGLYEIVVDAKWESGGSVNDWFRIMGSTVSGEGAIFPIHYPFRRQYRLITEPEPGSAAFEHTEQWTWLIKTTNSEEFRLQIAAGGSAGAEIFVVTVRTV